jgi:hypothetical protein
MYLGCSRSRNHRSGEDIPAQFDPAVHLSSWKDLEGNLTRPQRHSLCHADIQVLVRALGALALLGGGTTDGNAFGDDFI